MKSKDDAILKVKTFITELTFVQNEYFNGLCQSLGLTDEGKDWLFDYIFNETESTNFDDFLNKFGKTFGEMK